MKLPAFFVIHAAHLCLLRIASLLVPFAQRAEWRREWSAEFSHICGSSSGRLSWQSQRCLTSFCLGAFHDALSVREFPIPLQDAFIAARASGRGSANRCLLLLSASLAAFVFFAWVLPGVHSVDEAARNSLRDGLVLIRHAGSDATISPAQYLAWKSRRQRYFDGLGFYRISGESSPTRNHRAWTVAHASFGFFALLGIPLDFPAAPASGHEAPMPSLILSHEAWIRDFRADPRASGSLIVVGSRIVRIAGVVPYGTWRLPGSPDAWLLESSDQLTSAGSGFVLAHLTDLGKSVMTGGEIAITDLYDGDELTGMAFTGRTENPWNVFTFALFLAVLALPAVTAVSMSESSFSSHRPPWNRRILRWFFLAAKVALVAGIAYFAAVDLAYARIPSDPGIAEFFQFIFSFTLCLFGLRWTLFDQRQRCPVCLRRVTHPAQVGLASHTFLGWNGTELMCIGGHTLLHVPALPTSWFATQRWMYLDNSWDFLFAAGSGAA